MWKVILVSVVQFRPETQWVFIVILGVSEVQVVFVVAVKVTNLVHKWYTIEVVRLEMKVSLQVLASGS